MNIKSILVTLAEAASKKLAAQEVTLTQYLNIYALLVRPREAGMAVFTFVSSAGVPLFPESPPNEMRVAVPLTKVIV